MMLHGLTTTDEMGLGKTVELLACIFAHQRSTSEGDVTVDNEVQISRHPASNLKRLKRERVECICGALNESLKYKGTWVQCDVCDAWQHADCVGYSPIGRPLDLQKYSKGKGRKRVSSVKKKRSSKIVEVDGTFICELCSELIQASNTPIVTGATLIVCPAPILQQWHAEIIRYVFFLLLFCSYNHFVWENCSKLLQTWNCFILDAEILQMKLTY